MAARKPWTPQQAENFWNEIAESIEQAKPSEIVEDLQLSENDLDLIAARMKAAALAGIKQFQHNKLNDARRRYQERVHELEARPKRIAGTAQERRVQFFALLQSNPGIQSALTMQYRDISAITDSDIESALEDLDALGALNHAAGSPEDAKS